MAIFTSYYGSKIIQGKAVSISLYPPKDFQGEHLPLFAPNAGLLNWYKSSSQDVKAQARYSELFAALLAKRKAEINEWVSANKVNDDITFLCYEKSGDFCHRHQVAELLKGYLGDDQVKGELMGFLDAVEVAITQQECDQIWQESEAVVESLSAVEIKQIDLEIEADRIALEQPKITKADESNLNLLLGGEVPKAKRTRKPSVPKDPATPKAPRTKKPTKAESVVIEAKKARENFQLDQNIYDLDPLVVEPTEYYINLLAVEPEIGFDLETLGYDIPNNALSPETGEIRLIQAYLPSVDRTIIWDCGELNKTNYSLYGIDVLIKRLISRQCKVFIHNAAFEFKWIAGKLKKPILNVVDSMILSQVYYAGLIRGFNKIGINKPNSLEQVCLRILGIKPDKQDQSYDYAMPLTNRQLNYAAKDPKLTYLCGKKLLERCEAEGLSRVVEAEMMSIPAFGMMEYKGIPFDTETAQKLLVDYTNEANKAIAAWLERFPNTNPGSPKQVLDCLKQLDIEPKNADGKLCTDNATLTPWALKDPLIDGLLFWRSLKKDCEYLTQYMKSVTEQKGFQVIRTRYSQNAAQASGRTSSSSPNLQNIPTPTPKREKAGLKAIRTAFKAPPGYKMIIVDLAASHQQLARHVSQDKQLIEAHKSGVKFHFFTVAGILQMRGIDVRASELAKAKKDPTHELYKYVKELYDPAKTVFYGCVPMETQILTRQGWKLRHEIKIGDLVASHNTLTGSMEWTPIQDIFDYDNVPLMNLSIENGSKGNTRWSITTTPNHRWFGTRNYMTGRKSDNHPGFFQSHEIKRSDRILTSSKLICSGQNAYIPTNKYDFDWVYFVLSLSSDARTAWLSACLVSEGHIDQQGSWNFTQNPGNICEAMKLAAYLEGHRITTYDDIGTGKNRYATQRIRLHRRPHITGQKMLKQDVGFGQVWCVATKNSTFVIKQGETITITGNSLNLNGAATLQASFLKKADMLVDLKTCKSYVDGGRKAYAGLYRFQQQQIANANKEQTRFEVDTDQGKKFVGVFKGYYGVARSFDGGRLFIEKMPSKYSEGWQVKGTDAVSFAWLRPEGTIMKKALGLCAEKFIFTPQWNAWLCEFTHDEVGVMVKEEHAYDCAKFTLETVTNCFKEFVPDYEAEDLDPNSYIVNSWADK